MTIDKRCVKQRALFSDHLDGQKLPFWRALLIRFHLRFCPQCQLTHRSLETTRDALRDLRDRDPL